MRMRNGDGPDPTELVDPIDCLVAEHGHAIPQEISAGRLHEQGTLSDGKGRFSPDPDQVGAFFFDSIGVAYSQLIERGPLLPLPVNELPLVQTNRATACWLFRSS